MESILFFVGAVALFVAYGFVFCRLNDWVQTQSGGVALGAWVLSLVLVLVTYSAVSGLRFSLNASETLFTVALGVGVVAFIGFVWWKDGVRNDGRRNDGKSSRASSLQSQAHSANPESTNPERVSA